MSQHGVTRVKAYQDSAWRRWLVSLWEEAWRPEYVPLGLRGERLAARFLRRKRYKIVAHSNREQRGELDLVAVDGRTVVFVEVKTRQSEQAGEPFEAVDEVKQARLTRLALTYLRRHRLLEQPARFDVVSIFWPDEGPPEIEHFENAFEATE